MALNVVLMFLSLLETVSQEVATQQEMELSCICCWLQGQLLVSWLVH